MRLNHLIATLCLALMPVGGALAQSQFSPAITVNNAAITPFEIDQRRRMLELFRTPGDLGTLAREQLIEDRLKEQAFARAGIRMRAERLEEELVAFAERANLDVAQFEALLGSAGVDPQTWRDFVRIGTTWRDYIRSTYSDEVTVSDAEIDRAAGRNTDRGAGIEVLLSEIIIPAPPPQAARANAIANQIAQTTSLAAFSAAAREYSALRSRDNGGRLGWLPVGNYPPQLQSLILGLRPGEVTAPIQIPNGVALFQLRDVREAPRPRPAPSAIEYAAFTLPGGDLRAAQDLALRVDSCDDLYGAARGLPEDRLQRLTQAPSDIPQDVALELARLDRGEVSYDIIRAGGQTRVFLMLCDRVAANAGDADRDALRNQLRSARLSGLADALLANLRAAATIRP